MTDQELDRAFATARPVEIWQTPFDYDPSHFVPLCNNREKGTSADPIHLYDYALDLQYEVIQNNLFRYLLPVYARAWRQHLHGETGELYAGFSEQFWMPFATQGEQLFSALDAHEREAFQRYITSAVLKRIERGGPFEWLREVNSLGAVWPEAFADVWNELWSASTPGRALGVEQYLSALSCEDHANAYFPDTRVPCLWEDSLAVFDRPWPEPSISLVRQTLQGRKLNGDADATTRFALRVEQLLAILAQPHYMVHDWDL